MTERFHVVSRDGLRVKCRSRGLEFETFPESAVLLREGAELSQQLAALNT